MLCRCIGESNHRYFLLLLTSTVLAHFTIAIAIVNLMAEGTGYIADFFLWGLLVYHLYVAVTVAGATVWQVLLLGIGTTGYQRMKGKVDEEAKGGLSLAPFCNRISRALLNPDAMSIKSPNAGLYVYIS
jgi:hypothetical protein